MHVSLSSKSTVANSSIRAIITARTRVQAEQPTLESATNRKCTPITISYGLKHARGPYHRSARQS